MCAVIVLLRKLHRGYLNNKNQILPTSHKSYNYLKLWRREWQLTPVFLPGEIPWIEEPGGLQSVGLQRVGHD